MQRGQTGGNTADASPSKQSTLGISTLGTHRLYGLAELWWVACSAALALGISVATGLIPKWGQWYSVNMAYRRQTEAMLNGSLALDKDPRTVGYDMAWASDGVQQVWGLGVPSWRLPFELVAKLFGQVGFPDRLALTTAMALLTYALLRLLVLSPSPDGTPYGKRHPEAVAGALWLILFPPFLALCRTRFDVYEEAQAYSYLAGIALFALTLWFARRPNFRSYVLLAGFSGLAAFVRPTLIFYGFASLVIAFLLTRRQGWRPTRSWAGPFLFCLGGGLLFLTNAYRFGSGFEFGHQLNLNVHFAMMYATRFENPVLAASLSAKITELFSILFLVRDSLHCCDGYDPAILPGQAPVIRWRDIYFSTYDLTYLALILAAWAVSLRLVWRSRANPSGPLAEAAIMGAWSFISAAPLFFLLYLNYPVLSSRYMMDFAPAFAVAIWALLQFAGQLARTRPEARLTMSSLLFLLLGGWWGYQVFTAKIFPDTGGGTVDRVVVAPSARKVPSLIELESYSKDTNIDRFRIPFNGYGWWRPAGRTSSIVVLFLPGATRLELDLRPVEGVSVAQRDWDQIQVKIGREQLVLESTSEHADGRTLRFTRPPKSHPSQIEVAFIRLTRPRASLDLSKFQLERVRWDDASTRSDEITIQK
jgi:hypothetical protein